MIQKFSPNIISKIHSYVYIYIDPRTDEIFYVGKGKGKKCDVDLDSLKEFFAGVWEKKACILKQVRHKTIH